MGNLRASILTRRLVVTLAILGAPHAAPGGDGAHMPSTGDPTRIVHRFDFDERAAGNLETLPKYWSMLRPRGFPHFAEGSFDYGTGRAAPPSFHLDGKGRSVAYLYAGPETRVRAHSDYRIEGYIRPDGLSHARACLSAHFLDKQGHPLSDTLVRSRYVGGPDAPDGWVAVELYLAAAPAEAYSVGLVAWVLQESGWRTDPPLPWHVPRVDVAGAAWFDDITIYRLPRAEIRCMAPGNVIGPGDAGSIEVLLADHDDAALRGRLSIVDADGATIETRALTVDVAREVRPGAIDVSYLAPGLYRARLEVFSDRTMILERSLTFARLAETTSAATPASRSFGVVLAPAGRPDPDVELALLDRQRAQSAKIPVWGIDVNAPDRRAERHRTHRFLQQLVNRGFILTGVFGAPPAALGRDRIPDERRLVELLNDDPSHWQQYVASVVAPYASAFRWWQLGRDGVAFPPALDTLVTSGLERLREVMTPYLNAPLLTVPLLTGTVAGGSNLAAEQVCVTIGQDVPVSAFPELIRRMKQSGGRRVSVYIEPLDAATYERESRLAHWARRLIAARHAGADTVFVPQTWRVRRTPHGVITEPDETYILMRTLASMIADAEPVPPIELAGGVRAFPFRTGDTAVLAVWDESAGQTGSPGRAPHDRHPVQLGRAAVQVDLWGRATELPTDEHGRQVLTLSRMPVLVPGVPAWLLDLRRGLSIAPARIQSGRESEEFTVELAYRGTVPLSGTIFLDGPDGWSFSPRSQGFSVLPQRTERLVFRARIPHSAPAGRKPITARIGLTDGGHQLDIPLTLEVGLADVEVSGLAVLEGNVLHLRHVITNRSDEALSFRVAATVPGRERQYRPVPNLMPGETQAVTYRIPDAAGFVGRNIRLGLYELGDGPRVHTLELTVP